MNGQAGWVRGRSARVRVDGPVLGDTILSVTTIGRGDPTCAESTRRDIIRETLQHETKLLSNPFFRALWFSEERLVWPKSKRRKAEIPIPIHPSCDLNDSQRAAVQKILSDKDNDRIVLVQGPPGTGKTTVTTASVMSHHHVNSSRGIYGLVPILTLQSKTSPSSSSRRGFKNSELLYRRISILSGGVAVDLSSRCFITSDMLHELSTIAADRLLLDCKVILCTLSMFSSPAIDEFLRIVQVEVIILDETSQIECGDYIPIFHQFRSTLSKLVLIGDDKQCVKSLCVNICVVADAYLSTALWPRRHI